MQQCPNCGHPNRAGVVFCENCGASLIGKMPLDTKSLNASSPDEQTGSEIDSSVLTDVKVQGSSVFKPGDKLKLNIEGSAEPIVFEPKEEAIFGRRDPATGAMPDVDLTPYAGYRMGVSRRHAAIRQNDEQSLDVWDLGSSNGTFLNGQRLSAHRPYRLHNGDELRLGQMQIRVLFDTGKPDSKDAAVPSEKPAGTPPVDKQPTAEQPGTGQDARSGAGPKPVTVPAPAEKDPAEKDKSKSDSAPPRPKTVRVTEGKKPDQPSAPDQQSDQASEAAPSSGEPDTTAPSDEPVTQASESTSAKQPENEADPKQPKDESKASKSSKSDSKPQTPKSPDDSASSEQPDSANPTSDEKRD